MPYTRKDFRVQSRMRARATKDFHGMWEIWKQEYMVKVDDSSLNATLNGTVLHLDENEEVYWKIPDNVEFIPLFTSDMYQVRYDDILFYLPCGDEFRFNIELDDKSENLILRYQRKLRIHCKKIQYEDVVTTPFNFVSALDEGSFSDMVINSDEGQQFKTHKCILHAVFPTFDWSKSSPLSGLPSNLISTILKFAYSGMLDVGENIDQMNDLKDYVSKNNGFEILKENLDKWNEVNAVKHKVSTLTENFDTRLRNIAKMIHRGSNLDDNVKKTHLSDPSTLVYTSKEIFREAAIGLASQLQMMYIFASRERELTKEEKKEIIKIVINRSNSFLASVKLCLETLHKHMAAVSKDDLTEFAKYIKNDIEKNINSSTKFFNELKVVVDNVVQATNLKHKKERKKKVGMKLKRIMKNALHIKELSKLEEVEESIVRALVLLNQRSEQYREQKSKKKLKFIVQFTRNLVSSDLEGYIMAVDKPPVDAEDKSSYREFKYIFQYLSSYSKWLLEKIHDNMEAFSPIILKIQALVASEEFDDILRELKLLPKSTHGLCKETSSIGNEVKVVSRSSFLPSCIRNLYESQKYADLEFHVKNNSEEGADAERIAAHRVVVASRCAWFKRALESGMKETYDRVFHIGDCTPYLFRLLIKFLYHGNIDLTGVSTDDMMELMELSDRYEVSDFQRLCQNELIKHHMTNDTALCLLAVAENMSATKLKEAAMTHIRVSPECCRSRDYDQLPDSLQDEIQDMLDEEANKPEKSCAELSLESITKNIMANPVTDSESDSDESAAPSHLDACIQEMRSILGEDVSDQKLLELALAADNDVARAINFYYEGK